MFEATPFAVVMSPVVRVADPPGPRNDSAAKVAVAGATATNRDDFAREHVKVALSGCGGSARADVDLARDMTDRLAAAGAALARGEISYSHARVLSTVKGLLG